MASTAEINPTESTEIAAYINDLPIEVLGNQIFKYFSIVTWLKSLIFVCKFWYQAALKSSLSKQLLIDLGRRDHKLICNGILTRFKIDTLLLPHTSDSLFLLKNTVNASPKLHTLAIGRIPHGTIDGYRFSENSITINDEAVPAPAVSFPQITTLALPAERLSFLVFFPNVKNLKLESFADSLSDFKSVTTTYPSVRELEFSVKSPDLDFSLIKRIFPSLKKTYILYSTKLNEVNEHWNQLETLGKSIGIEVACRFYHLKSKIFEFSSITYAQYAMAFNKSPLSYFVRKDMSEKVEELLKTHTNAEYERDLLTRPPTFHFPYLADSVSFQRTQKFNRSNLDNAMINTLYHHGLVKYWRAFIEYINNSAYPLALHHLKEAGQYPEIKKKVPQMFLKLLKNVESTKAVREAVNDEVLKKLFAAKDHTGETVLHDYARDGSVIDLSPFKDVIDWNVESDKKWNPATLAFDRNNWDTWLDLIKSGCDIQVDSYQSVDYIRLVKNVIITNNNYEPLDIIKRANKPVLFGVASCYVSSGEPPKDFGPIDYVVEKYGEDPNGYDKDGASLFNMMLSSADIERHALVLERVMDKFKVDINHVDKAGYTPLTKAVKSANSGRIIFALEHGANPNFAGNTLLPLHLLCSFESNDFSESLEALLAHGANINGVDFDESGRAATPLSLAVVAGQTIDDIKLLIMRGADPKFVDEAGNTMLHTLLLTEKIATITRLVEPLSKYVNVNKPNKLNETPLHRALLSGYASTIIDALVKNGADVNQQGGLLDQTPLMMLLQHSLPSLKPLLREGNVDLKLRDKFGRSFVHYFFEASVDEIKRMMDDKDFLPILEKYITPENLDFIAEEVKDVVSKSTNQLQKIFYKVTCNLALTKFFLDRCGFDVNLADARGHTLLSSFAVARKYSRESAEYIISKGADVNKQTDSGDTALMICLQKDSLTWEQYQHRQILLKHGASVTIKNKLGVAPIDLDPLIETRYANPIQADFVDDRSSEWPKANLEELRKKKKEEAQEASK